MALKLRGTARFFLILIFVSFLALAPEPAKAAIFDPSSHWKTIETKHFRINYPERVNALAQETARILEEIYPQVTEKWDWRPLGYTEVVLVDNTDESNGFSSVLPYNWMLIYAVPPSPDSPLAHYSDWLKTLLVHEYTHIVQIDAYGGIWYPFRIFLGKTISPSGINPTWIREGVAQFDETIFTDGGRGRGSYSEMVVRSSILENSFPPIDVADGLGWKWPGYRAAYIYGIKFIQWLVDTYGEDKFMQFDRRVRSSIMLAMINHQSRNVYGKTFYELWREWKKSLEERYAKDHEKIEQAGLSTPEVIIPSNRDEQFEAPTLSPDGSNLVYTATSPHGKPEVRLKQMATGEIFRLKKGSQATQYSWSPDGTKIIYSAIGSYKKYNRYFDLWMYDFDIDKENKRIKKLTSGMRARDPDFYPDGKSVVFVNGNLGTDTLKKFDIETKKITTIASNVPRFTQFANPRISPDGRFIAVSVWKPGYGWRIYRYNIDGTNPMRLTKGYNLAIESRPTWTRDGRFIIFSSDESQINNLYRVSSEGGDVKRLTNVLTGAFQPTVSMGDKLVAQYYTSKGFEIVRFEDVPEESEKVSRQKGKKTSGKLSGVANTIVSESADAAANSAFGADAYKDFTSRKYVAFGKSLFLPRFIVPGAAYVGDAFFLSLMTGGTDVLRWHNWLASANYRTDAKHLGYTIQYWYSRFKPAFGALVMDYAVDFGNLTFRSTGNSYRFFEHRRGGAAYFSIPIQRHNITLAYYYEDHMALTNILPAEAAQLNLGIFAGMRAEYRYGDAEMYPASISKENGRNIRLTSSVTDSIFGSEQKNEQIIFSGDWREFILLGRHNVFALRAAGGMTWGKPLVQGTFGVGGALGEGSFGGGGSFNYFPLRGVPVSALAGTRAMLFSGEYRFPIIDALRGLGTVPVFLKDISGALFADYGNAWVAHQQGTDSLNTFFDNFLLGVGAELRANVIVGHGLPIHGRLGYAIIVLNRYRLGVTTDPVLGTSIKNGMIVLALGTAF